MRGQRILIADEIHSHPYGVNVARLGAEKLNRGETVDPLTLVPSYSHQPNVREFSSHAGK